MSNSEISQKTAELKAIMQEKNQLNISNRLSVLGEKKKRKTKKVPIWRRPSS